MNTALKLAVASILLAKSAFAMNISQDTIDMFQHATDGFQIHSVDDKLNGLTRLEATQDCDALDVLAGQDYLLFWTSEGFNFRAYDATENTLISHQAVRGLDLDAIGTNYDDSEAPVAIVASKQVCRFVTLPSL